MFENLEELTANDLASILNDRLITTPVPPRKYIRNRIVPSVELVVPKYTHPNIKIIELQFENCRFIGQMHLGDYVHSGVIIFKNCRFEADVRIVTTDNIILDGYIEFLHDCSIGIAKNKMLTDIHSRGFLSIHALGEHRQSIRVQNINFQKPSQKGYAIIYAENSEVQLAKVNLENVQFVDVGKHVSINDSNLKTLVFEPAASQLSIMNCHIDYLNLKDICDDETVIELAEGSVGEIEVNKSAFGKINILLTNIQEFIVKGIIEKDNYITIFESILGALYFVDLYNNGILSFRGITMKDMTQLYMFNANLGKTDFIACDFRAATWEFENSKITELFLAETDFPTTISSRGLVNPAQAQLAFGQLRSVFEKQGDTIRALEYQSREIESHYKAIPSFFTKKGLPHFTKLNLFLNRLSNNFGRDWGRGVVFSLAVGLVCFTALVWTTPQYTLHGTWKWDPKLVGSFFRFLNPLRFFELEVLFSQQGKPYLALTGSSYFVDLVGRIGLTYGYYQTIQAFRRYGRK